MKPSDVTWRQLVAVRASARIERLHEELDEKFRLAVELDDAEHDRKDA